MCSLDLREARANLPERDASDILKVVQERWITILVLALFSIILGEASEAGVERGSG
jgi:hypothetical protein